MLLILTIGLIIIASVHVYPKIVLLYSLPGVAQHLIVYNRESKAVRSVSSHLCAAKQRIPH